VLIFYVLLFGVWCDFTMNPLKKQHQIFVKISGKVWRRPRERCDGDRGNDWTSVWGRKHEPYTESPNSPTSRKGKTSVGQKVHAHYFLLQQGDFSELVFQAKQSIQHTVVTFYDDWTKMCEDFKPNSGDKGTDCCITTPHRLTLPFSPGTFRPQATWVLSPTHPNYLSFPYWTQNSKAAILTQLRW
jgi:hypothetical protein